jgi:3-isopropylmalate/(R)-2-methylmalate dehydratase small subunit
VLSLQEALAAAPAQELQVSVDPPAVLLADGRRWELELQAGPRQMLLTGQWDATSQLLAHGPELERTAGALPYLNGF